MTENPYAAPKTIAQPIAQDQTSDGLWREGDLLVMHKDARLRETCVKTGDIAATSVKRKFSWHPPWLSILIFGVLPIYLILSIFITQRANVSLPLSESAYSQRKSRLLKAWIAALLSIASIIGGFFMLVGEINDIAGIALLIGGFVGIIVCLVIGQIVARILKPIRITKTHVWFKGVHPNILDQCPTFDE